MHRLTKNYYFIKNFNTTELKNLNSNTSVIYRNYEKKPVISELLEIKKFCKRKIKNLFIKSLQTSPQIRF